MKTILLEKFKAITHIEEEQLKDHLFHREMANKTLTTTAVTQNLPVLSDDFFKNDLIYLVKHQRFAPYPLHTHTFFVLNYVVSGEVKQIVNGSNIHLHTGDILLLNIGTAHQVLTTDDNDIMINFSFHANEINIFKGISRRPYLLFKNKYTNSNIRQILEMLIEEYLNQSDSSKENIMDFLHILNRMLKRNIVIKKSNKKRTNNSLAQQMLFEIHLNYNHISLKQVANKLNYNPSYLGTVFKKNIGESFHQVLLDKRLTEAYQELLLSSLTIDQIARKVGFTRKTTFYNGFERKYHKTPNEIRNEQQKFLQTKTRVD